LGPGKVAPSSGPRGKGEHSPSEGREEGRKGGAERSAEKKMTISCFRISGGKKKTGEWPAIWGERAMGVKEKKPSLRRKTAGKNLHYSLGKKSLI